jgi:hypothetical protein
MIALLSYWRVGLVAALLAAAGVWHYTDKTKAVDAAVTLVRAEYINAALAASESARTRESQLIAANAKVSHDFQIQKTRNAANARVTAGKLRDLQAAIASADTPSADTPAASGINGPFASIAGECGRALVALDEHAATLASTARALQQYAASVRVKE